MLVRAAGLPKPLRLTNPADFKRVFSKGRRIHQPPLSLVYVVNGLAYSRIGLAIGKRLARRAVERNRVKRQIRESFRLRKQELDGVDCVFYLNGSTTQLSNAALRCLIDRLWQKV